LKETSRHLFLIYIILRRKTLHINKYKFFFIKLKVGTENLIERIATNKKTKFLVLGIALGFLIIGYPQITMAATIPEKQEIEAQKKTWSNYLRSQKFLLDLKESFPYIMVGTLGTIILYQILQSKSRNSFFKKELANSQIEKLTLLKKNLKLEELGQTTLTYLKKCAMQHSEKELMISLLEKNVTMCQNNFLFQNSRLVAQISVNHYLNNSIERNIKMINFLKSNPVVFKVIENALIEGQLYYTSFL